MNTHKPADEYYLHDHGEGNGWQILSKGPGKFGVATTSQVNEDSGVIELIVDQYIHGALSTTDTSHYMLSPEEAYDMGQALLNAARDGEAAALTTREAK